MRVALSGLIGLVLGGVLGLLGLGAGTLAGWLSWSDTDESGAVTSFVFGSAVVLGGTAGGLFGFLPQRWALLVSGVLVGLGVVAWAGLEGWQAAAGGGSVPIHAARGALRAAAYLLTLMGPGAAAATWVRSLLVR